MIEWLLDLDMLSFGAQDVEFGFARPLAPWGWAMVVLGAGALAWFSYRRLEGARTARLALAGVRALVLVLLAVLIAGPRLVRTNETEEQDWVLVLVDRSASMTIPDAPGADPQSRRTREAQLREALDDAAPTLQELDADRVLVWLGLGGGAFELQNAPQAPGVGATPALGEPSQRRTAIARALEQALDRAAARPLSGIVLLSDGRSVDEPTRALMRRLTGAQAPIFSIPLGRDEPLPDYAVRSIDAPRVAFVDDAVPVRVEVERLAGDAGASGGVVELVDTVTGEVLSEARLGEGEAVVGEGPPAERFTLTTRPGEEGSVAWAVRVRPGTPDLIAENNQREFGVDLIDRPLRVLHIDGYPRWEYHFLKELLRREGSITSSTLLLAPERRFLREGDVILPTLPTSPEEWSEFDVVLMGDVRPEVFTREQLEQLRELVAVRGAGLVWIGGEAATPDAWRGTPLEDLLPMALSAVPERAVPQWDQPVTVRPLPAAAELGLLNLAGAASTDSAGWPAVLSDPETGWSLLRFAQRIEPSRLKPTAQPLAVAVPEDGTADPSPLVVSMRYGAGRSVYIGTDEIWRWRYGRGEYLPERFWVPIIRLLGRESLMRTGRSATLAVTPDRAEVGEPVRVTVELIDQALLDAAPATLTVRIVRLGDIGAEEGTRSPERVAELVLSPLAGDPGQAGGGQAGRRRYGATWTAPQSGRYAVEASDPLLVSSGLSEPLEVWLPDDELRRPETDHALLAELSEATGGRVLSTSEIASLPDLLPNRRVILTGKPDVETLWDTPLALILMMLLLTAEWVGRRLIRLV